MPPPVFPHGNNGGWLSLRTSKRLKRSTRGGDDDGLPFSDKILLIIFAYLVLSLADLVRCAATCRRWLRLVSTEPDFICRSPPPSEHHRRSSGVAFGFFHQVPMAMQITGGVPWFIPLSLTASRFPGASNLDALSSTSRRFGPPTSCVPRMAASSLSSAARRAAPPSGSPWLTP
ncbi:hypothetical protein EJB05_33489, partial [Eragrostis curvula]